MKIQLVSILANALRISRDLKSLVGTGDPRPLRKTHPNPSIGGSSDS